VNGRRAIFFEENVNFQTDKYTKANGMRGSQMDLAPRYGLMEEDTKVLGIKADPSARVLKLIRTVQLSMVAGKEVFSRLLRINQTLILIAFQVNLKYNCP